MAVELPSGQYEKTPFVTTVVLELVLVTLGTLFVLFRLYTRAVLLRALQLDDYLLVVSVLLGITMSFLMTYNMFANITHSANGSVVSMGPLAYSYANLAQLGSLFIFAQNGLTKISLLLSYQRITPTSFIRMRMLLQYLLAFFIISTVVILVLGLTPCWPPRILWYTEEYMVGTLTGRLKCWSAGRIFMSGMLVSLFCDAIVYVIPFFLVSMARMERKQRWATYSLFAFGAVVFIISVARIPYILSFRQRTLDKTPITRMYVIWILSFVESNGLMIAASVPTLRPLLRSIKGLGERTKGSTSSVKELV